jgi:chromate transporter
MKGALLSLAGFFTLLSLLSFGGGNTVLPQMHRQAVDVSHWMTDPEFAAAFAITQAAPGPGMLIVTLIGLKAAGWLGALVATLAMFLPCCLVTYLAVLGWGRFHESRWGRAVERGLAPVALGLIFASSVIIARAADHGWRAYSVTAFSAFMFTKTKINPLILVAAAAFAGAMGWL